MKRRMATIVLFVGAFTSRMAYGDTWNPGNPKPIEEPWYTAMTTFFSDFWTYLVY